MRVAGVSPQAFREGSKHLRTTSSQGAGSARGLSRWPGAVTPQDPASRHLLFAQAQGKPASEGTEPPCGALLKQRLCLRAPRAGSRRTRGHPAVANSCVSAPAGPRPSAGSAPPPSPPLQGGGGTESARPGGF